MNKMLLSVMLSVASYDSLAIEEIKASAHIGLMKLLETPFYFTNRLQQHCNTSCPLGHFGVRSKVQTGGW